MYWWKDPLWWNLTLERVLNTMAQTVVGAIMADQIGWFTRWYQIAISVGTMMTLAFLTQILRDPRRLVSGDPRQQ